MHKKDTGSITGLVPTEPTRYHLGKPLKDVDDVKQLQQMVETLWDLLDDIDTAGDMFKERDDAYRSYVQQKQRMRFRVLMSDGYELFLAVGAGNRGGHRQGDRRAQHLTL